MKKDVEGIIRKRSLIAKTRKTVFIWVAGASCAIGAVVVIAVLLVQTIIFNSKIISMKSDTLEQVEANIAAVPELEAEIRLLNTNKELKEVTLNEDTRPVQTILDALPADDNRLALGASLQQRLFTGIPGLSVDSLSVDPSSAGELIIEEESEEGGVQELAFTASISGNADALKAALQRLERSIRAINVKAMTAATAGDSVSLQVSGSAYYLPEPNLDLTKREVKQ